MVVTEEYKQEIVGEIQSSLPAGHYFRDIRLCVRLYPVYGASGLRRPEWWLHDTLRYWRRFLEELTAIEILKRKERKVGNNKQEGVAALSRESLHYRGSGLHF